MEIYGMSGEKLGIIGQPTKSAEKPLPAWKKAFTSLPSVSVRKGIASNFDVPYEDTATLVLTAPSGKFVDVRLPLGFYLKEGTSQTITEHPSFWAFSGTVTTNFLEPPGAHAPTHAVTMPYSAHARFEHDLDSKGPGIIDEGDMFLLPNGDTMEVGIWTNPSTGKYEMYKEYWTEPHTSHQGSAIDTGPESGGQTLAKEPWIVAETIENGKGRGILMRIGNFAQGIYQAAHTKSPMLFVRYEQHDNTGFASEPPSQDKAGLQWLLDPRSTGDGDMFPINLIFQDYKPESWLDQVSTLKTGIWSITEHGNRRPI